MKDKQKGKCHLQQQASMLLFCTALLSSVAIAHNKVVVIPMGGDDAISHPVATTLTNSIGMQFNQLPAGSFTMGSPAAEPGRDADEVEHAVILSQAFNMQTTEVTNAQWNDVIVHDLALDVNPSTSHSGDTYPVESVTWYDAVFFANELSSDEGRSACYTFVGVSGLPGQNLVIASITRNANCTGYSLPTEAQWEYAARAGTTKAYANPIGFDDADNETGIGFNGNMHAMGWYRYNQTSMGYTTGTKPVAKKQANGWGLYDMHGNVYEWNWDWFAGYTGDATDPSGPASGLKRVRRGGSRNKSARYTRSANRSSTPPQARASELGFRLVLPQGQ